LCKGSPASRESRRWKEERKRTTMIEAGKILKEFSTEKGKVQKTKGREMVALDSAVAGGL